MLESALRRIRAAGTTPPEIKRRTRLSFRETVLLGALAGFTIYLGLPFARLQLLGAARPGRRWRCSRRRAGVPVRRRLRARVRDRRGSRRGLRGRRARASATRSASPSCSAAGSRPGAPGWRMLEAGCARAEHAAADRRRLRRAMTVDEPTRSTQAGARAARAAHRHDDRRRDRAAQLRRGPGDRRLRQHRRDQPRDRPDHRLRAPQRDRGLRHRRPARLRPALVALARPGRPDRRRPVLPRLDRRLQRHLGAARARLLRVSPAARSST